MIRKSFLCLMLFVGGAFATTVVPMSIERLTQASSHVVVGDAIESWSRWNSAHTQIFTYTRFHVARTLKGATTSELIVKQMGGRADGYEQKVAGVRHLSAGEKAVLFVHPSQAADGTMVITGLMQGNFRIVPSEKGGPTVSNDVPGVDQVRQRANSVEHYSGSRMALSALETAVVGASQGSKQ